MTIPSGTVPTEERGEVVGSLAVLVLGLLTERDMHPYEMQQLLRSRREERLTRFSVGSLYRTVQRLAAAGLVREVGCQQQGNRPQRTVYGVTDAGRAALARSVAAGLRDCGGSSTEFLVALNELHSLPREEAADVLRGRVAGAAEQLQRYDDWLAEAVDVPRLYLLDLEYQREVTRTQLRWLTELVQRIDSGRLPWPS